MLILVVGHEKVNVYIKIGVTFCFESKWKLGNHPVTHCKNLGRIGIVENGRSNLFNYSKNKASDT